MQGVKGLIVLSAVVAAVALARAAVKSRRR